MYLLPDLKRDCVVVSGYNRFSRCQIVSPVIQISSIHLNVHTVSNLTLQFKCTVVNFSGCWTILEPILLVFMDVNHTFLKSHFTI